MPSTEGFVGTIEAETDETDRVWFSLTASSEHNDWVKIGAHRAWFTMNMETTSRPTEMAKLTLLLEAMRNGLAVRVRHGGTADFHRDDPGDSFEAVRVRVLRSGLHF